MIDRDIQEMIAIGAALVTIGEAVLKIADRYKKKSVSHVPQPTKRRNKKKR